jgi:hypothetical protein
MSNHGHQQPRGRGRRQHAPRPICGGIAAWTLAAARESSPLGYELLDLAEVNLPFLDEPLKAALHQ